MKWFLPVKPKYGDNKRVYYKYLSVLLVVTCVPVLILSGVVYGLGTRETSREITAIQQKQIENNAAKIEEYFSQVELMATQWTFSPLLGTRLNDLETKYDYKYILELYDALFTMEGSNRLVKSAFIYLDQPEKIITITGGISRVQPTDAARLHEILSKGTTPSFWVNGLSIERLSTSAPVLVNRLSVESVQPYAALVLVLDESVLTRILGDINLSQKGVTLLLDEKAAIVSQLYEGKQSWQLKPHVISQISRDAVGSRSGTIRLDGEMYQLTYRTLSRLSASWIFVNATSITELTRPVAFLSQIILGFGLIGIALAVVLSLIASGTVFRHWNQVHSEMKRIRERLNEQRPEARTGFLLQLLLRYTVISDEALLKSKMQKLGWSIPSGSRYRVVLFILDGFAQSGKRFLKGDEQLATFAASNIIGEISEERFPHREMLNFQDLTAAMLLIERGEDDLSSTPEQINEMGGLAIEAIRKILGMDVTVIVCRPVQAISELPSSFEEGRWLLGQRRPLNNSSIVYVQDYVLEENHTVYYPFGLEQEIVEALRRGDEGAVMLRLEQFCQEVLDAVQRENDYYQCLLQLLGAIRSHMLRVGFNPFRQVDNGTPYEQLYRLRDAGEILAWFRDTTIRPFLQEMQQRDSRHDSRLQALVNSMIDKVRAEYKNELSLDAFAEEHGVNNYTLSRIFRQETGENFIDYLTHVRLEASKKLLSDTDMPIQDIAESVGYRQTYYYRIFKKTVGLTPSQYRTACAERK